VLSEASVVYLGEEVNATTAAELDTRALLHPTSLAIGDGHVSHLVFHLVGEPGGYVELGFCADFLPSSFAQICCVLSLQHSITCECGVCADYRLLFLHWFARD
jgi:hypothetical protein